MENNLALLIDFENIAAGTEKEGLGRFDITAITERLADKGRVLIARSYADWGRFSRFKQSLLTANVTMYELTSHGMQDKNRADIAMVVDALELAFTKDYIETFVIVSGDSDFTPLVLKMRELDKRVIGIGTRSSTSRLLVNACDEFIFYDTIVKDKRSRSTTRKSARPAGSKGQTRQRAFDLLSDALSGLQREDPNAMLASVVKRAMRRKTPDFSENELGFSSFARFLENAQDAGYCQLEKDRKAGGYRVDSPDAAPRSGEVSEEEEDTGSSNWEDQYMPKGTDSWIKALDAKNLNPMSYPTRMQVLQMLEQVVGERRQKRRKCSVQYVREDVRKRLQKTLPDIPSRLIRGLLTALLNAGLLIHKDGTAIRSASATFHLEKNAEQLNKELITLFLNTLAEANTDLHDAGKLAELFLGESSRKREIEEALAWIAQSRAGGPADDSLNDIDLDDLLSSDGDAGKGKAAPANKTSPKQEPAKKTAPKKSDDVDLDDLDALLGEDDAPAKKTAAKKATAKADAADDEDKPAPKKRTRKPSAAALKKKAEAEAKAKAKAEGADEAVEEKKPAPKKRTRKPSAAALKKKAEAEAKAEADAKDGEDEEAPKATTRTRKRTRKPAKAEPKEDGNDGTLDDLLSES